MPPPGGAEAASSVSSLDLFYITMGTLGSAQSNNVANLQPVTPDQLRCPVLSNYWLA
jgi:hypothetical protein